MAQEHKGNLTSIDPDSEKLQGHISAFTNAVFAFAITMLILDIRLPEGISKANLPSALVSLWPNYLAFLISFFVIGLYWSTYIRLLKEIVRTDRTLIWLILLFLLFIVLIPFSTYLISLYLTQLTVIIYAAIVACAGYIHTILRVYAGRNHRLVSEKYSSRHIERNITLSLIAPICFTISIGIAFLNSLAAQLSWILIFAAHIILGRILRFKDI
jgi:uncharacterized membrane protein